MGRAYEVDPTLRPEGRVRAAVAPVGRRSSPTGSGGPRPGSSRRCSRRARSPATAQLGAELLRARRAVRLARPARRRGGRRDPRDEGADRGQAGGPAPRRAPAQARARAASATSSSRSSCSSSSTAAATGRCGDPGTLPALRALRAAATSPRRTPTRSPTPTGCCARSSTGSSSPTSGAPTPSPTTRTGRSGWPARSATAPADGDAGPRRRSSATSTQVQSRVRELHAKLFFRPLLETYATLPADAAGVVASRPRPGDGRRGGPRAARGARLPRRRGGAAARALDDARACPAAPARCGRCCRRSCRCCRTPPTPTRGLKSFRELVDVQGDTGRAARPPARPPAVRRSCSPACSAPAAWPASCSSASRRGSTGCATSTCATAPAPATSWPAWRWRGCTGRTPPRPCAGSSGSNCCARAARPGRRRRTVSGVGEELTALGEACLTGALSGTSCAAGPASGRSSRPTTCPCRWRSSGWASSAATSSTTSPTSTCCSSTRSPATPTTGDANKLALDDRRQRHAVAVGHHRRGHRVRGRRRPAPRGPQRPAVALARRPTSPTGTAGPSRGSDQALLKARLVAGDRDLGTRLVDAARELAYPEEFGERDAAADPPHEGPHRDGTHPASASTPERHLKLGPGGLSDVEWTVQLLQLRHGATTDRRPRHLDHAGARRAAGRDLIEHGDASLAPRRLPVPVRGPQPALPAAPPRRRRRAAATRNCSNCSRARWATRAAAGRSSRRTASATRATCVASASGCSTSRRAAGGEPSTAAHRAPATSERRGRARRGGPGRLRGPAGDPLAQRPYLVAVDDIGRAPDGRRVGHARRRTRLRPARGRRGAACSRCSPRRPAFGPLDGGAFTIDVAGTRLRIGDEVRLRGRDRRGHRRAAVALPGRRPDPLRGAPLRPARRDHVTRRRGTARAVTAAPPPGAGRGRAGRSRARRRGTRPGRTRRRRARAAPRGARR